MAITSDCHPHCGIRSSAEGGATREGHCSCPDGPCPQADAGDIRIKLIGRPMCARWYERAGDRRPWLPDPAVQDLTDAQRALLEKLTR